MFINAHKFNVIILILSFFQILIKKVYTIDNENILRKLIPRTHTILFFFETQFFFLAKNINV
jgi:hypothetical protein